jgi:membrane protease YdiL (CAAX protease family)
MIKRSFMKQNISKTYIIVVLLSTWVITIMLFINPTTGKQYFPLIMFIPAVLAIIFNKVTHNHQIFIFKNTTLKSLLFGIAYPIVFIVICSLIAEFIGIGKLNIHEKFTLRTIITIIITILVGLFLAWGEEYGWRGFLLPKLTNRVGKIKATIIVGIIWGLYHIPAVFLLAKVTGIGNPILLCIVQAIAAFTYSFPSSYCYYSSSSLLPVLFLHSVWDTINPLALGDIYTNKSGLIIGNIVQINGEGIIGCILGLTVIIWFIKQFDKDTIKKS